MSEDLTQLLNEALKLRKQKVPLTIDDIHKSCEYKEQHQLPKTNNAIGQRKLFLEFFQLLTIYPDIEYVLYVGSAPGNMHGLVAKFFPKVKIILCDPRDHNIQINNFEKRYHPSDASNMYDNYNNIIFLQDNGGVSYKSNSEHKFRINFYEQKKDQEHTYDRIADKDRLKALSYATTFQDNTKIITQTGKFIQNSTYRFFIIQDLFNDAKAHFFAKMFNILKKPFIFISDIRTLLQDKQDFTAMNDAVLLNMAQQYHWTKILQPNVYSLKFRFPFNNISLTADDSLLLLIKENYGNDFYENFKNSKMQYFDGTQYIQAWEPLTSTESRLIGTKTMLQMPDKIYDEHQYAAKFHYYNNIQRPFICHNNPMVDRSMDLDYCADCALEVKILLDYKKKINNGFDTKGMLETLRILTFTSVKEGTIPHGQLYEPLHPEGYQRLIKEYIHVVST